MGTTTLDLKGLTCPQPTLKMTIESSKMKKGDVLEVMADCHSFADDVKNWCERRKKVLLWIRDEGSYKRCQVQM
ncbi:MAG: sulfurtransferase TusA family protein [Nitrospirae bacterium]|nr:sulfurtransferase TusA family protein [Nitrospirota bacterium]MBF0540881.1 sulfurtransferase TusA family protein [Nitrospirota bacterium]